MRAPRSVIERFESIGRNELTGESGGITPTAIGGVPDFSIIEAWVERGNHRARQGNITPDVFNLTVERDERSEEALYEWIRHYSEGRQQFQDHHVEKARQFSSEGQSAMGIIAARQVLEIPWRGSDFGGMFTGGYSRSEVDKALGLNKRQEGRGVEKAFSVPASIKDEMEAVISKGRAEIDEDDVRHWSDALETFQSQHDLHAAGLSALEATQANLNQNPESPLIHRHSSTSLELINESFENILETPTVKNTAETDELVYHLRFAAATAIRFDEKPFLDRDILKRAGYKLDDFGEQRTVVRDVYKHLARRSLFMNALFFHAEARGVEKQIELNRRLDENPSGIIWNPPKRKNRRHKRP